jgi:hypothetical protein
MPFSSYQKCVPFLNPGQRPELLGTAYRCKCRRTGWPVCLLVGAGPVCPGGAGDLRANALARLPALAHEQSLPHRAPAGLHQQLHSWS